MAGKQDYSSSNEDAMMGAIAAGILGMFLLIYYNFHAIAEGWRWIRYAELFLFQYIPPFTLPVVGEIDFSRAVDFLSRVSPYGVDISIIHQFDNRHMPFIGVPMGLYILYRGLTMSGFDKRIGKVENLESLFEYFAGVYPYLEEIRQAHPEKKPLKYDRKVKESYRWAKELTPFQFARLKPPLGLEKEARKNKSFKRAIWEDADDFDEDLAERAFAAQLGEPWQGEGRLTESEEAAFNYLKGNLPTDADRIDPIVRRCWGTLIRVTQKKGMPERLKSRKLTEKELDLIDAYKSDFKVALTLLSEKADDKKIAQKMKPFVKWVKTQKNLIRYLKSEELISELVTDKKYEPHYQSIYAHIIMAQHNYVRTGLMELNEAACAGGRISLEGVKSTIKGKDRPLWAALKSAGRQVAFPEGAGVYAHWLLEKDVGRPIAYPSVQEAVEALRKHLQIDEDDG